MKPALQFNEPLNEPNMEGIYLSQFREKGWVTLPHVFDPDSVDEFRAQVESAIRPGSVPWIPLELPDDSPLAVWPAKAPRLLEFLKRCLPHAALPVFPVLIRSGWIVRPSNSEAKHVHDWHKDGDHENVSCANGYAPPNFLHVAMYFEDMTPECGPTWAINRSHRDGKLSPFEEGFVQTPFSPGKADVVVWDPRLWHCGGARTKNGTRICAVFNYVGVIVNGTQSTASPSQQKAYFQAQNDAEKILYGGQFVPFREEEM